MTYNAYLIPAVDFAHLEDVLVITQIKEPLQPLDETDQTQETTSEEEGTQETSSAE